MDDPHLSHYTRYHRPERVPRFGAALGPYQQTHHKAEEHGGYGACQQLDTRHRHRVNPVQDRRHQETRETTATLLQRRGAVQLLESGAAEARLQEIRRSAAVQVRLLVRLLSPRHGVDVTLLVVVLRQSVCRATTAHLTLLSSLQKRTTDRAITLFRTHISSGELAKISSILKGSLLSSESGAETRKFRRIPDPQTLSGDAPPEDHAHTHTHPELLSGCTRSARRVHQPAGFATTGEQLLPPLHGLPRTSSPIYSPPSRPPPVRLSPSARLLPVAAAVQGVRPAILRPPHDPGRYQPPRTPAVDARLYLCASFYRARFYRGPPDICAPRALISSSPSVDLRPGADRAFISRA